MDCKKNEFKGPIFIIGVGRSGTKLLRTLLNNHSRISIPDIESQFIPSMLKKFGHGKPNALSLLKYFEKTTFFIRKKDERPLKLAEIERLEKSQSISEFIELVLKLYSPRFKSLENFEYIWGDKTPFYIREIPVLNQFFSNAKYIHIIRDPRDVSLSYKKTWNKNIYAAAEKWRLLIDQFSTDKDLIKGRLFELYYEDLLTQPEKEIRKVCSFLNISYEPEMLKILVPTEFYGTAKGNTKILTNNKNKYLQELTKKQIRRIEQITKPTLIKRNYKLTQKVDYVPLKSTFRMYLKIIDALKLYHHLVFEQHGFIKGTKVFFFSLKNNYS